MKKLFVLLAAMPLFCFSQSYQLVEVTQGPKTSMRGISIVNDNVAWVSGSGGYVAHTVDAGKTWDWTQVKGFEKNEFRDIQAFDQKKALAVSIGSPGYVMMTTDGGKSWTEVYKNSDSLTFYDGMDFWDKKRGLIYGDPIGNKLQVVATKNGGESWRPISQNIRAITAKDESSFAASGTGIRTIKGGHAWIITGGGASNIYHTADYGSTWSVNPVPITVGDGAGPFSVAFKDANNGIVVGGCYKRDKENADNVLLTNDGGKTWRRPKSPVLGFRSAVEYLSNDVLIATGTSGTDISTDGGENWTNISTLSFNAVIKSPKGNLVLLTGNRGEIYQLKKM